VHRHVRPKRGDFFRPTVADVHPMSRKPIAERLEGRLKKPIRFCVRQLTRESERRHPGSMENLIRIGVANAAEQPRICQGSFQGVILTAKCPAKLSCIGVENLEAARIQPSQF